MSRKLMSLFSILNMQSALDYEIGEFPYGIINLRFNVPKGSVPSDIFAKTYEEVE